MIAFRDASSLEKKSAHPIRAPPITPCARQENGTIVPVDLPSSDCWENDPSSNSTPYQGPFLLKFFSRSQEFANHHFSNSWPPGPAARVWWPAPCHRIAQRPCGAGGPRFQQCPLRPRRARGQILTAALLGARGSRVWHSVCRAFSAAFHRFERRGIC